MEEPDRFAVRRSGYRWIILGGLWFGYGCFGIVLASVAPLVEPMRDEFGLSRTAMGSILGAWPLLYIAAAVPAGAVTDRLGIRWSVAIGVSLIALSALLRAVAVDYITLFLAVGVFGLGGPLVSVGAPKLARLWFPVSDRPAAIGIYTSGPLIGVIFVLATANSVVMPLTGDSWRLTLLFYGAVTLASVAFWLLLTRGDKLNHPPYSEATQAGVPAGPAPPAGRTPPTRGQTMTLFGVGSIQMILLVGLTGQAYSLGFLNWLPDMLQAEGKSAEAAGYLSAIPILAGTVLALGAVRLVTPDLRIAILMMTFIAGALAPLLLLVGSDGLMIIALVAIGSRTLVFTIAMVLLMDVAEVTAGNIGIASGLYFAATQAGGVIGPLMIGALTDATGGFEASLLVLSLLSLVLVPFVLPLKKLRPGAAPTEETLAR